jgi:NtrC-family two-component system sensor histidine kinase KinB
MRLRTWLIVGYGAVLALATLGLGLGLVTVANLSQTSGKMVADNFAAVDLASRLRRLMSAQQLVVARRLGESDPGVIQLMPPFEREARALLAEARALQSDNAADREALTRAEAAVNELVASVQEAAAQLQASLPAEPRSDAVPAVTQRLNAAFEALRAATLEYYSIHHAAMLERGTLIREQSRRLAIALALLAAFTVLVGVLVSLRLASRLSRPMERLADAAARVAHGDFSVRVGRTGLQEADLVAQRFDDMTAALGRFHAMNLDRIVAESRRLDQVVAHIDEGLVIFDEQGRIERANPIACEQLGLDAERVAGRRLDDLVDQPVLAEAVRHATEHPALSIERAGPRELVIGAGDEERTLSWNLLPFSDAARLGLILALRDVTAARQFERMRTDFVLRASHELRTPITGMRMSFGLLEDKLGFAAGTREAELVQTLGEEMQRLVNLVNALLDLSRLYARAYAIQPTPGRIDELLERARLRFAPMVEGAGLTLGLELPGSLPTVPFDADALDRVLDNLVGNAVRHTPAGGSLTLGAQRAGPGVEVYVRDTGEGIAHADRARVFEPFVQVGNRAGGVGLGLAMCREIVRQHGGTMRLDSAPGRGSCFRLTLPG